MTTRAWFSCRDKNLLLQHGTADLLALAQRRGAQLHKLLHGTSIFEADLTRPLGRICHLDWFKIIDNCQQQLKSPELPYLLGAAMLQNRYISLCQALMSAENLAQALRLLHCYRHQLFPGIYPQLLAQSDAVLICVKTGFVTPQQRFANTVLISLLHSLVKQQFGSAAGLTVLFREAEQGSKIHHQQHLGSPVMFSQLFDGIRIEKSLLFRQFKFNDVNKLLAARRSCAQLSRILPKQRSLAELIYHQQRRALPTLLTAEVVASSLGLSNSVFRRQLTQEFISFNKLVDEVRQNRAQQLLQERQCSNKELANLLGYSDEHNFRRAFKRWTGFIPSNFRDFLGLST
jgi:AraC-like DNA-binding protein